MQVPCLQGPRDAFHHRDRLVPAADVVHVFGGRCAAHRAGELLVQPADVERVLGGGGGFLGELADALAPRAVPEVAVGAAEVLRDTLGEVRHPPRRAVVLGRAGAGRDGLVGQVAVRVIAVTPRRRPDRDLVHRMRPHHGVCAASARAVVVADVRVCARRPALVGQVPDRVVREIVGRGWRRAIRRRVQARLGQSVQPVVVEGFLLVGLQVAPFLEVAGAIPVEFEVLHRRGDTCPGGQRFEVPARLIDRAQCRQAIAEVLAQDRPAGAVAHRRPVHGARARIADRTEVAVGVVVVLDLQPLAVEPGARRGARRDRVRVFQDIEAAEAVVRLALPEPLVLDAPLGELALRLRTAHRLIVVAPAGRGFGRRAVQLLDPATASSGASRCKPVPLPPGLEH